MDGFDKQQRIEYICDLIVVKDNAEVIKQRLIDEGNIIIKEIPKHNDGHHIYYYAYSLEDELRRRLGENLIFYDKEYIVAKTSNPKYKDLIGDILRLYNKKESSIYAHYDDKTRIRVVRYEDSTI